MSWDGDRARRSTRDPGADAGVSDSHGPDRILSDRFGEIEPRPSRAVRRAGGAAQSDARTAPWRYNAEPALRDAESENSVRALSVLRQHGASAVQERLRSAPRRGELDRDGRYQRLCGDGGAPAAAEASAEATAARLAQPFGQNARSPGDTGGERPRSAGGQGCPRH